MIRKPLEHLESKIQASLETLNNSYDGDDKDSTNDNQHIHKYNKQSVMKIPSDLFDKCTKRCRYGSKHGDQRPGH